MSDVPIHKSKWQKDENETFKIRFSLKEVEQKRVKITTNPNEDPNTVEHWVEFKMWDYEMMLFLRKKATKYYKESGSFYVDHDLYNDLKISYLLKSWSFGEIDPHMKLQHHNNVLTDESFKMFRSLYPWIVNSILLKMNSVLEGLE